MCRLDYSTLICSLQREGVATHPPQHPNSSSSTSPASQTLQLWSEPGKHFGVKHMDVGGCTAAALGGVIKTITFHSWLLHTAALWTCKRELGGCEDGLGQGGKRRPPPYNEVWWQCMVMKIWAGKSMHHTAAVSAVHSRDWWPHTPL